MALFETAVAAVAVSREKGTPKISVDSAVLRRDHGLVGDAHAGPGDRQVSILALPGIRDMEARFGSPLGFGRFGENLVLTDAILGCRLGDLLSVGERVVLEVTAIGKECHLGCAIRQQTGDCIMPREGVFARVVAGGTVVPGDKVRSLCPADDLTVAILAGGRSGRFGSDKRLAQVDGRSMFEWCAEVARLVSPNVLVSLAAGDRFQLPPGFVPVFDAEPDIGPLAGILACLRAARTGRVVFIPVDMPMVSVDHIKFLAARCDGAGVAFRNGDRMLPLPACYDRGALGDLESALANGDRSLGVASARAGVSFLDASRFRDEGVSDRWLCNVNTPADLAAVSSSQT
jgi:molybdopterin-guanine dinucleotide biosynthesis protein A